VRSAEPYRLADAVIAVLPAATETETGTRDRDRDRGEVAVALTDDEINALTVVEDEESASLETCRLR